MLCFQDDNDIWHWQLLDERERHTIQVPSSANPPMVLGGKSRCSWNPWMTNEDPDSEDYKKEQTQTLRMMNTPFDYEDLISAGVEDRDDLRARGIYQDPEELE